MNEIDKLQSEMSNETLIKEVERSERWINGVLKYHWIISICFIESDERISLEYDYSDKVIRKIV